MSQSPESSEIQTGLLQKLYTAWDKVIESKGQYDDFKEYRDYMFSIDREKENESNFTADEVLVNKINEPLEDYTRGIPSEFKSRKDENWLYFYVVPKDPYRPKFAVFRDNAHNFYYVESLAIAISNSGRALQATKWGLTLLKPDQLINPFYSYMKALPAIDNLTVLEAEPEDDRTIEPFGPLNGQNFERLKYLLSQVQLGNVLERGENNGE